MKDVSAFDVRDLYCSGSAILFRNNLCKNIDIRNAIIVFILKTFANCRISFQTDFPETQRRSKHKLVNKIFQK